MDQIRIVVVDDNTSRREQIKDMLPEYVSAGVSGYGDEAMKMIKPDSEGNIPNLVILNGDDSKGQGLYTFDWMINKSGNALIAQIPVIVLCEDEFSDRALDFLEVGDVTFYEGPIEENDLFDIIMQTLDSEDFAEEPAEPVYEESKSIDRLIGHSVKVPTSVPGKERKIVVNMDSQLQNLEAALLRGQKRVEDIRKVLSAAQNGDLDDTDYVSRPHKKQNGESWNNAADANKSSSGSSIFKKAREKNAAPVVSGQIENIARKAVANPQEAMYAQAKGIANSNPATGQYSWTNNSAMQNAVQQPRNAGQTSGLGFNNNNRFAARQNEQEKIRTKKRIVVVDDDQEITRSCQAFLSANYEVVCLNSSMAAIDYFIRSTADMLIIDAVMPGMSGQKTVESIRFHQGGARIPVIYLMGNDFGAPKEMLMGNNVVGIVSKPISWGALAVNVDGYFRGRR